jgi:hypothetical protein
MVAYMWRIYLEWARLMADEVDDMDFHYKESMDRI